MEIKEELDYEISIGGHIYQKPHFVPKEVMHKDFQIDIKQSEINKLCQQIIDINEK